MEEAIKKWQNLLEKLISKKPERISNLARNKDITDLGVYAISTPDNDKIVYVGKTKIKSIPGRMYDHLMHKHLDTDSDLANMVIRREHLPQDYSSYLVRYVPLENSRDRMRFEMFTISILNPELNKDDNKLVGWRGKFDKNKLKAMVDQDIAKRNAAKTTE